MIFDALFPSSLPVSPLLRPCTHIQFGFPHSSGNQQIRLCGPVCASFPFPSLPLHASPSFAGRRRLPIHAKGARGAEQRAGAGAMDTGTYSLFPFFPSFLVAALLRARSHAVRIPARTVREEGPPRNRSCRQHMYDTSLVTINCVAKYVYGPSSFHL